MFRLISESNFTFLRLRLDLDGHRPRVRRYANGLKKLIRIGQGEVALSWHVLYWL